MNDAKISKISCKYELNIWVRYMEFIIFYGVNGGGCRRYESKALLKLFLSSF